eukprot:gnl/MRDRNA2_/MRDRNA2_141733_c0_seq1.p1 gnl/MRDRNA2_/MRDRNA2_141733_c0~~gnl/MRDRNA2_/MRDRNA2_141733_c0_seq1.p1  ORF type:complete len:690 (+),score=83.52 gnl/MRDRNA2_/MRDRNA2_141733_c0_seq1:82-2151(+)
MTWASSPLSKARHHAGCLRHRKLCPNLLSPRMGLRVFASHSAESMFSSLTSFRQILDQHIVGHASVKEAVLLGILAREHVYIEGPPGVAKTFIAELVSESAGLSSWFYQMHRDTRLHEIIGEAVIRKEGCPGGEIIREDFVRGGLLTCEIAVLDDISRAPGEALNVLLRILNERTYGATPADRIPLLSAIATGNPAQEDAYFAEPLDPATLDRFALQVRVKGHINDGNWSAVSEVLDLYSGPQVASDVIPRGGPGRDIITSCCEFVPQISFGESVKLVLIELLRVLREEHALGEDNSLLTDRTFLIKAVKILKANAFLKGRLACEPDDLYAVRHMTTFRVPDNVHEQMSEIIDRILAGHAPPSAPSMNEESSEVLEEEGPPAPQPSSENEGGENEVDKERRLALAVSCSSIDHTIKDMIPCSVPPPPILDAGDVENLRSVMQILKGRLEDGNMEQFDHPGGQPRSWSRIRTFSDIMDADLTSAALWCESPGPRLPRSQRRVRRRLGGRLIIIRDTSLSMSGLWDGFASLICAKVVDLAKQFRMHVGYLEFNNSVTKFMHQNSNKFFTREYATLLKQVHWAACTGSTNYEMPLNVALSEFQQGAGNGIGSTACSNRHILFLTDGYPNEGNVGVSKQIELARALRISIHTLFLGSDDCPSVLDRMSLSTKGARLIAQMIPKGCNIRVITRS